MTIEQIDLSQAASIYAVSNTPLFLIRKLREDPAILELARRFSGDEILAGLRRAVEDRPTDLLDYVRPYVYLVALSMKENDAYLRVARELPNAKKWDWSDYVALVLLQTYAPTSTAAVRASSSAVNTTAATIASDAPLEYEKITA